MTNEAFSRVVIESQLADQGWKTKDPNCIRYEYTLPDCTRADYVLCDRYGRSIGVIEAKRFSNDGLGAAVDQARGYASQLNVPYFLANGKELRAIPVPLPPMSLQETFLEHIKSIHPIHVQQGAAKKEAETIFDALLAHFLTGEQAKRGSS